MRSRPLPSRRRYGPVGGRGCRRLRRLLGILRGDQLVFQCGQLLEQILADGLVDRATPQTIQLEIAHLSGGCVHPPLELQLFHLALALFDRLLRLARDCRDGLVDLFRESHPGLLSAASVDRDILRVPRGGPAETAT